jgi:hypothetical protein
MAFQPKSINRGAREELRPTSVLRVRLSAIWTALTLAEYHVSQKRDPTKIV